MRRLPTLLVLGLVAVLCLATPANAVTNGTPDGSNHPYVGVADNGVTACSGTLLSRTVMLTAAHCFSDSTSFLGTNTATGAPLVEVSFDPNLLFTPVAQRKWTVGTYYFDPEFSIGGGGLPHFDTHDVAVIIFGERGCRTPSDVEGVFACGTVPVATTSGHYGKLPQPGMVGPLAMGTRVDLVGYGVQNFLYGGGPCLTNCKKDPGDAFTRFFASTTLVASEDRVSGDFVKLHSNNGGMCFGDSGGPDLLGGTNTVLAVNSFVANDVCSGNTYSYRVDTPAALGWITKTIAAHGAAL